MFKKKMRGVGLIVVRPAEKRNTCTGKESEEIIQNIVQRDKKAKNMEEGS